MKCLLQRLYALSALILMEMPLLAQSGDQPATPKAPVAQYVVALLATLLVMVILCKPSRKS